MQQRTVPRSLVLDYAFGICSVWISAGFFLDAWAHGHVPVESFFTLATAGPTLFLAHTA